MDLEQRVPAVRGARLMLPFAAARSGVTAVTDATDRGILDEGFRLLSFGLLVILLFAFVTAHFVG